LFHSSPRRFPLIAPPLHDARFDEPRFPDNAAKETRDRALVEWSNIGVARALYNLTLARTVAEREASGPLGFPDLDGEPRSLVEEAKQLRINRINRIPPVFNAHLIRFLQMSGDFPSFLDSFRHARRRWISGPQITSD
jgi:hypothetical protein